MPKFLCAFPCARALCCVAVLLISACAPTAPPPRERPFIVQTHESARAMSLAVRQELRVRLPSNPSTGYGWTLVSSPQILVQQGPSVFEQQPAAHDAVGVPGTELWTFRALASGEETLRFEYRRAWEKDTPPIQSVTYRITVQ